ncbi:MAG: HD-GYP domain-containing protein [Candidatus Omnitrophota bacterium]|jgi:HD-GYP domain-containing protein (c-di-GMP phosphodiesterase class II)|nr:MAG: HD-GYP domain-containing protein [Candidatus Omnitrophota bacterium]
MKINPTKTINELITVLAYITDIDEKKKSYHTWRVAILSCKIAEKLVSQRELRRIFYAAVLHDIGGAGFPYNILHYLKKKDKESQNILFSHPILGAQLVSNIPQMTPVAKLILDHHEWVNGHGYPRGKTNKFIPIGSKIIRIADSIDIAIQTGRFKEMGPLLKHLSTNVNKEYSYDLFSKARQVLSKGNFYRKLLSSSNIPLIFQDTKEKAGFIKIPSRVDAIGTALEAIAQIIDMKHPYTSGHSLRVSRYAMGIALAFDLDHDYITKIKWSGLIHDIGKISLSRQILDKPSKLTPKEFIKVKTHASLTNQILNMMSTLKEIALIASSHHERFDGKGYPLGLKGEKIPLGARILAVCDAFDAMTSNRPYRRPLTPLAACKEMEKRSGTQFDPLVVKQAIPLFKNLKL